MRIPGRLVLVFVGAAAFAGGWWADDHGYVPSSTRHAPLAVQSTFEPFWEAWETARQHHVHADSVSADTMAAGAIKGMLDGLGDGGHTTYLSPRQVERLRASLDDLQDGVGASVVLRSDGVTVTEVVARSPARAAGLQEGDRILAVDGQDARKIPNLLEHLEGPAGSSVCLRILRRGAAQPIDVPIVRDTYETPAVTWAMVPGAAIADISIRTFSRKANGQLRRALLEARHAGVRGAILDLRGNPGGLRDQAVAAASEFLGDGTLMFEVDSEGRRSAIAAPAGGVAIDLPVVVLVDEGTASAAEIVAAALQDRGRAVLVGNRTFGTGTVLQSFSLSDGGAVLLAVAKWLPPNGHAIWHKGLTPTIEVARAPGTCPTRASQLSDMPASTFPLCSDPQLLRAVATLRRDLSSTAD